MFSVLAVFSQQNSRQQKRNFSFWDLTSWKNTQYFVGENVAKKLI